MKYVLILILLLAYPVLCDGPEAQRIQAAQQQADPTSLSVSKINTYATGGISALSVSKANTYAVGGISVLSVSKVNTYVVLTTAGGHIRHSVKQQ